MRAMQEVLEIPGWANGPDGSANGGYAAGLLAERSGLSGAVEVNLRLPPPLDEPLEVRHGPDGVVELWTNEAEPRLVASARSAALDDLEVPAAALSLTAEHARAAATNFPYAAAHPFPRCLCCGIEREPETPRLDLHCGAVPDVGRVHEAPALVADTWVPTADLADPDEESFASVAACWSALDCPSAAPFADPARPAVLARIEAELVERARIGEECIVVAWPLGRDGRKLSSASALIAADGRVLARARALWIEVRAS